MEFRRASAIIRFVQLKGRVMPRRLVFLSATAIVLIAGVAATAIHVAQAAFPGPNGKIAFGRQLEGGNGEIFVMDADGSGQTNLTNDPAFDYFPAGSPDGMRIAFTRCPRPPAPHNCEIFVMKTDGTGQTNLTNNPATHLRPAWSPAAGRSPSCERSGSSRGSSRSRPSPSTS